MQSVPPTQVVSFKFEGEVGRLTIFCCLFLSSDKVSLAVIKQGLEM